MKDKIAEIGITMFLLFLYGFYFYMNEDNPFLRKISKFYGYDLYKASRFYGVCIWGIAFSLTPIIAALYFDKSWLVLGTILILVIVFKLASDYISKGNLK